MTIASTASSQPPTTLVSNTLCQALTRNAFGAEAASGPSTILATHVYTADKSQQYLRVEFLDRAAFKSPNFFNTLEFFQYE